MTKPHITRLQGAVKKLAWIFGCAGGSLTYKSILSRNKAAKPHGDPGGIRTRIIGVRGRPPKPLEDGAISAGFYLNLPVVVISADTTGHEEYSRSSLVDPSYELRSHSQTPLSSCGASPDGNAGDTRDYHFYGSAL